jgi:pimeloyl-ACP methyl ester carboxylesterase
MISTQFSSRNTMSNFVTTRGVDLYTRVQGEGNVLLWSHGLTFSMATEDAIGFMDWGQFPEHQRLIRYDARGHGRSSASSNTVEYQWPEMARDMFGVADHYGAERFIAGGQSMGCATSIYAALQAPDRIKGLVLMCPPTAWETRAEQASMYRKMAKVGGLLGGKLMTRLLGFRLANILPPWLLEGQPDAGDAISIGISTQSRNTLKNLFLGASQTDLPELAVLASLAMPTLILAWSDDPAHPLATAQALHLHLPNSTLVVAERYSDLEKWPELLRQFVAELEGGRSTGYRE